MLQQKRFEDKNPICSYDIRQSISWVPEQRKAFLKIHRKARVYFLPETVFDGASQIDRIIFMYCEMLAYSGSKKHTGIL